MKVDANHNHSELPDVSEEVKPEFDLRLDQVGMSDIEVPVMLKNSDGNFRVPARVEAFVSLDAPNSKGIHMSRLYLSLKETLENQAVCFKTVKLLLQNFVDGQKKLSKDAHVKISYEMPVLRKALVSEERGWRYYPIVFTGALVEGAFEFHLSTRVVYSSTCPCSAALAKQLVKQEFAKDFSAQKSLTPSEVLQWLDEKALYATPHAQRSHCDVKIKIDPTTIAPEPLELIDLLEDTLQTPVQAAVKREDEQEFARRNGQNMMFCEDAARKIKNRLEKEGRILDFIVKMNHIESLHPHNAVAIATKGIKGGFRVGEVAIF